MTQTALRINTYDPAALAADLAANNLPGRRSKTAIIKLRTARRRANAPAPATPALSTRLTTWLLNMYRAEIARRGGETAIWGGDKGDREQPLAITDRSDGLTLLHVEGWRYYSPDNYRRASLSYLCGRENGHPWAVRVAGTITTVQGALAWITPVKVKDAQREGRRVVRQGDVYAIETSQRRDRTGLDLLPPSHWFNPDTRYLVHRPADGRKHAPVRLAFPFEIVMQRVYEMGRSGNRANGD